MTRHLIKLFYPLIIVVTSINCTTGIQKEKEKTNRPDVIPILTDDQGWGDLRLHGNKNTFNTYDRSNGCCRRTV